MIQLPPLTGSAVALSGGFFGLPFGEASQSFGRKIRQVFACGSGGYVRVYRPLLWKVPGDLCLESLSSLFGFPIFRFLHWSPNQ